MLSLPCGCSNLPSPNLNETSCPLSRRTLSGQRAGMKKEFTMICSRASPKGQRAMWILNLFIGWKEKIKRRNTGRKEVGPKRVSRSLKITVRVTLLRLATPGSSYPKRAQSLHHQSFVKHPPYSPQARHCPQGCQPTKARKDNSVTKASINQ